jgi:hypothetical protein
MMTIESPEEVAKFLHLQTLSIQDLQSLCEDSNQKQTSKSFLIDKIMSASAPKIKSQGLLPQGIPLRSKNSNGKIIPKTAKTYQHWRKLIFETENNLKDFEFINKLGKQYSARVFYIKCSLETAAYMIENQWFSPYESQKKLLSEIKQSPEQFIYHVVRKNAGNGNNFLMLHCQKKEN